MPLILLVMLYSILAYHLIEKPIMKYYTSKILLNHINVARLLCTVIIIFFVCLLPYRVMIIWVLFSPPHTVIEVGLEKYFFILYFTRILIYLNSTLNPLLYTLAVSKNKNYSLQTTFVIF